MKTIAKLLAVTLLLATTAGSAQAAVHYVDLNSTNATPPYTNWTTAATKIQDAVDAAVAADEIVVTNGAYGLDYNVDTVVVIEKSVSVRSVNGPQFTWILGDNTDFQHDTLVWMTTGASLSGFTLRGGHSLGAGAGGGGAWGGTLNDCRLTGNSAEGYGGGALYCTLNNCTLTHNRAGFGGGGAAYCTLNNCTLMDNAADEGGAAYACNIINNCILFTNLHLAFGHYGWVCEDCDSPARQVGNNWVGNPLFVDQATDNLQLQSNSPCINAGNNSYVTNATDLDGNPRIAGGTVDIGAYEFQSPVSMISYAWLQHLNLPVSPLTDNSDPDGDGVNNYHEWRAGTNPTNRFSSPAQPTIISDGTSVVLTWSTNAVGFTLQSTTNLDSLVWSTNLPAPILVNGQNTVTNPISGAQKFYRLVH